MWQQDAQGNMVWVDTGGNTTQPASIWSDPVSTQNQVTGPSELNPSAGTWGDVLAYGLTRAIDVGTIKALSPDNTMAVLPGVASVDYMTGQPVVRAGMNRGLLMLMALGAIFLFVEERKG